MDFQEFACPRGHVFRALTDAHEMPCPSVVSHTFDDVRFCGETAHRIGPRVDVEARELCFA